MQVVEDAFNSVVGKTKERMVRALAHGLPGSPGDLYKLLRVSQDKTGKPLIQLFCKPSPMLVLNILRDDENIYLLLL